MRHTLTFYSLIYLLFCFLVNYSQTQNSEIFLVPITSKPSPLLRLQFGHQNDSIQIYGANLAALPLALKKAKFTNPKAKINFPNTIAYATRSIDQNYASQRDTSLGFRAKPTGQSYFTVLKTSFLSGKGSSPIFVNQNIRLGGFPAPANWPQNFTATVSGAGLFTVNYLPAISLEKLPVYDSQRCEDISGRFYKLRSLQGYGLEKITYKPYNARRRETVNKSFDIFFESGSAQPKQQEMKIIIDYLDKNQFEILNAKMEGGSSVEGDEIKNKKLQRDRAKIISIALSRYNKSTIKKDTILLSDNWPKFREQIKASDYAWLDSLSNEKILIQINSNDKLRKGLEPILKTQRKASLNLTMAKILTADDQYVTIKKSLTAWIRSFTTSKTPNKDLEPQIMGAISFLFQEYIDNDLNNEAVDSLLMGDYQDNKYMYLGLHIVKQFNENKFGPEDKEVWQQKWVTLKLEPWLSKAQEGLVRLVDKGTKLEISKYLKMQADLQAFSYRMINLNILDVNYLCRTSYPDKPEYGALTLNQFAFLYEMSNQRGVHSDCLTNKDFQHAPLEYSTLKSNSASNNSIADLQKLTNGEGLNRTSYLPRNFIKPTFSSEPKSPYYYLLVQGFVKGKKNILSTVDGNLSLDAFSLYHLLEANISNWKPDENYFHDKEIRLEEMEKLVIVLKKSNSLCTPLVNNLYLTYHRKALRYLELFFEPGSAKHKEIADGSLKFIVEYYKKRISVLEADFRLALALYLNRFNWFTGANEGAWYAFDFLSLLAKKDSLNTEELRLWANYLKIYDPQMKTPLPPGYTKDAILKAGLKGY